MYTHTDTPGQIYVSLYAPLPDLAAFEADNALDPREDWAPLVPEEQDLAADYGLAPSRVDPITAAGIAALARPVPPVLRDSRIAVHPDALRLASAHLGCVFTVEYASGDHRTFRVHRLEKGKRPLLGHVLTGHYNDDPGSYTYIGVVEEPGLTVRTTSGSKSPYAASQWFPLQQALDAIRTGVRGKGISAIDNAGTCSRCGRTLTHPESLKTGIGPECRTKGEGS